MPEKMSTSSQNNGKKSSNSSIVNTPSSTPLTSIANGNVQANTQSSPPPNNNTPKYVYGRFHFPQVHWYRTGSSWGGISANTTESELMQLFSSYGTVKAAKIIQDRAGVSKGYGFITFESEDDAKRPLREAENIVLRERKLNIAPAIKKQPFSRAFDASSPPAVAAGNPAQFFFPPGAAMPYFQGGVAYYPQPAPGAPGDPSAQQPVYQPPPVYPAQTGPPQTATYPLHDVPGPDYLHAAAIPHAHAENNYDYNYYQTNGGPPAAQYMVGNQGGPRGASVSPPCRPLVAPLDLPATANSCNFGVPAYSPADSLFYNLPVYGAAMEVPPVYTEAFDLGVGGPYSEDSYSNMADNLLTTQELDIPASLPYITSSNEMNHNHPPLPPPLSMNEPITTAADKTTPHPSANMNGTRLEERNSSTPVVSLLSIDQQQEKDYLSMRGGRRRKSGPVPSNNSGIRTPPNYITNGYMNPVNSYNVGFHPPPQSYSNYTYPSGGLEFRRTTNGFDSRANRGKVRRVYDKRSNNYSSRSSLRTDSNSSASCVDENKNEDKSRTLNTPPPAPYSPMVPPPQMKILHNTVSREFHNISRYPNHKPLYNNNNNTAKSNAACSSSNNNSSLATVPSSISPNCSVSQVHVTTTQSFAPQARRSRRSIRRTGPAGVSEIGAGDAPLPNEEVCKKFETLKL
ncbi:hypothetical protein NQ315_016999 [Exocentrus adspersus]|uniref:RRM domain-containing protein n=1 Tax=Exocentrus adspersus TaxID=1586481 RepID=A0AAV8VAK3_9CUCU|nr:hypothetical protein NQ315_016999 [Exocentrus adspersus]